MLLDEFDEQNRGEAEFKLEESFLGNEEEGVFEVWACDCCLILLVLVLVNCKLQRLIGLEIGYGSFLLCMAALVSFMNLSDRLRLCKSLEDCSIVRKPW